MDARLAKYGVREEELNYISPDRSTSVEMLQDRMNWKGKVGLAMKYKRYKKRLNQFYIEALENKECFYGPFKGEFGHFLLHSLPFLMHLHNNGVSIHYCGMSLHKPFMVDENGDSIVKSFTAIRDFFGEIKPSANENDVPEDVEVVVNKWKERAKQESLPLLEIDQPEFYWIGFRNWQLEGKQYKYDLNKVYARENKNSVVIFPRKKGGEVTPNNGGPWDYIEIAETLSPHFEKVYLVGHPSLSAKLEGKGNIEVKVSSDNADTLRFCAEANLIVTQHSGAVHVGAYVDTPVLLIFNGEPPIKGLLDTLRFRKNISNQKLNYAFSLREIEEKAIIFSSLGNLSSEK